MSLLSYKMGILTDLIEFLQRLNQITQVKHCTHQYLVVFNKYHLLLPHFIEQLKFEKAKEAAYSYTQLGLLTTVLTMPKE